MKTRYTYEDIRATYKEVDAFWTVFVVDPIAIHFIYLFANFTNLSPNFFTVLGLFASIISSYFFIQGYLLAGAVLFEVAFLLDCIDGKIARLTNKSSPSGAFFELLLDQFRLILVSTGIGYGQYRTTGDYGMIILSLVYIIFHLFWLSLWHIWSRANRLRAEKYGLDFPEEIMVKIRKRAIEDNIKPKGFRNILAFYALKNRIVSRYTSVEIDTIVFFLAPMLREPKIGFVIGILLWAVLTIFKSLDFSLQVNKIPRFYEGLEQQNKNVRENSDI